MSIKDRTVLVEEAGVPVSAADKKRIAETVSVSLASLDAAVKGSLFDTEPQAFDVAMRRLTKAVRP